MRNVLEYIAAFWSDWVSWMTGSVAAIFILAWSIYSVRGLAQVAIAIASIGFLVASYRCWLRKRERAINAEKPKYSKEIETEVRDKMERLINSGACNLMVMMELAMGKRMSAYQSLTIFGCHETTLLQIESQTGFIHPDSRGLFAIDAAFLPAIQDYLKREVKKAKPAKP